MARTRSLLLVGLLHLGCQPPPQPPPPTQQVHPVVDSDYLPVVLEVIDGAATSIDVMHFSFSYGPTIKKVQDALGAAAARGVRVRMLLDEEVEATATSVPYLTGLGIEAHLDRTDQRTHTKMVLADRRRLLFGSTNLTGPSIDWNHEADLLVEDERLGAAAGDYFEALFPNGPSPEFVCTAAGKVQLCPDRSFEAPLREMLRTAREHLDVQMYATRLYADDPTSASTQLLDDLRDAQGRGVKVRVILERSDYNDGVTDLNDETAAYLARAGIEVRRDPLDVTSHAKLIVSERNASVSSVNWSYGGLRQYHELGGFVTETFTLTTLQGYFDSLWAAATP